VAFVDVEGFAPADAARLRFILPRYVGSALDVVALERDLEPFTGLDRYQTVTWRPALNAEGKVGLVVRGRLKPYSPPFLMLGLNAENTRSTDFRITATARYLSYGVLGSGSELRVDGTLGSDPAVGAELYEPLGTSPVFFAPSASWTTSTFNIFADDEVTAQYGQSFSRVGLLGGLNLGARSDVRAGFVFGRVDSDLDVGDTGLGTIEGSEASFRMMWRVDTQDTPVVPQGGTFSTVALRYQRPEGGRSQRLEAIVRAGAAPLGPNLGFASAVAELGLLLTRSAHAGTANVDRLIERARSFTGDDPYEDRAGFVALAERAAGLMREARVDRR